MKRLKILLMVNIFLIGSYHDIHSNDIRYTLQRFSQRQEVKPVVDVWAQEFLPNVLLGTVVGCLAGNGYCDSVKNHGNVICKEINTIMDEAMDELIASELAFQVLIHGAFLMTVPFLCDNLKFNSYADRVL